MERSISPLLRLDLFHNNTLSTFEWSGGTSHSYTIGKERLFLEVARSLRKKVYVTAAKLHLLNCLEFTKEDIQWFTSNEHEINIHVAPMWTLASFKRLKHISSQYASRFSLIVAFSPTGWTFGKGKKKSLGKRWQQGTVISDWNPAMDQQAQGRCHGIGHKTLSIKDTPKEKNQNRGEDSVTNADVEVALNHVEDEADYMALKKVELEEAVDNQEFTEEASGRIEEDEYANEDDEPQELGESVSNLNKEDALMLNGGDPKEDKPPSVVAKEDDVDMLADVNQMAEAAAAAGQALSAFQSELRPIDRYAIRFLELWDPIIDKAALESEVRIEDTEWELDRIERDADFATTAYGQQVESLAQHQLMEELDYEAKLKEEAEEEKNRTQTPSDSKLKPKKNTKKAKFKSLKKGSLTSSLRTVKDERRAVPMAIDDDAATSLDFVSPVTTQFF
ncbi:hypothetical protein KIW84_035255 [Lathyrus oleraceus]|uniref:DNA repair metallo-beta-lactamase domain-containing protein n=1 Tax=Pisum sativum TaxID=3888 RepID=A0A9D5B0I1_PEA|nr:hypothetical protein KIW84_035255 [Pisum sativum]